MPLNIIKLIKTGSSFRERWLTDTTPLTEVVRNHSVGVRRNERDAVELITGAGIKRITAATQECSRSWYKEPVIIHEEMGVTPGCWKMSWQNFLLCLSHTDLISFSATGTATVQGRARHFGGKGVFTSFLSDQLPRQCDGKIWASYLSLAREQSASKGTIIHRAAPL